MSSKEKNERLSLALRKNLKKRKIFQKKKQKEKSIMSIQPDSWIKKMCKEHNMIEPFLDHQVSEGKISYGLSSMGYDVRTVSYTHLTLPTICSV